MKASVRAVAALLLLSLLLTVAPVNAAALARIGMQPVSVRRIDGLTDSFILGADISSLLSLEAGGRVFYGFDRREQDLLQTLSESGVNYIRVRVWNDPFDAYGRGYGGGNCTVDTAITLGRRAAAYGMDLLVDFHYSDFWADPAKQQAPKAWQGMSFDEKSDAIYAYTADSIRRIQKSGVTLGMVQIGNETTGGFCGETDPARRYALMRTASRAVRDTDAGIRIAVHFTNPEKKLFADYARELQTYDVDYDIFAASFYPEYHGTADNLKEQLGAVHELTGKQVMIAETAWDHDSDVIGAYQRSVQGQADEVADCVRVMTGLGDYAIGVFYWEPAWIDVPGETEAERSAIREACGAGWASAFAGSYDPDDAGRYYGATACIPGALFDPDGYPLESLKTFLYLRQGTAYQPENLIDDSSFEEGGIGEWQITEAVKGTVNISDDPSDAREGRRSLHFWSKKAVSFTVSRTLTDLHQGSYSFSLFAHGGDTGEHAEFKIFAVSGGRRYEQHFTLDGWRNWKVPLIGGVFCDDAAITVGIEVSADAGAWGSFDCAALIREPSVFLRGDADGDGTVTIFDVTAIQRTLVKLPVAVIDAAAADINGCGGPDAADAALIQRYLIGAENLFGVGCTVYGE